MNLKKVVIILIILGLIGGIVYFIANNVSISKTTEEDFANYTPEEEISDKQLRQTSITLFFLDKETNTLKSESKLIDSTELLKNPYKLIVQKLIEGPSSESFQSVFPENTKIIDASLTGNCVILNFSEELMNFKDDTQKFNIINSIINSITQLNEVESIKILINGETRNGIDQEYSAIS